MLIGITGTPGSGLEDVLKIICEDLGFKIVLNEGFCEDFKSFEVSKSFTSDSNMLDYVTNRWKENMVIPNIEKVSNLELFLKRPFFMLITVDSSLLVKYERFKAKNDKMILQDFCKLNDDYCLNSLYKYQDKAILNLINNSSNCDSLKKSIMSLNLLNIERLRPNWDTYFMKFADLAAERANCMKRKVGCVIVNQNRVIATGYNGTPRGFTNCNNGGCQRCNNNLVNNSGVGLSTCLCLHAEENALLEAGRSRITENTILYCNTCPCLTCSIKIVQVGISEVVYSQSYSMDEFSKKVFTEAGVKLRQFIPPTHGTFILE